MISVREETTIGAPPGLAMATYLNFALWPDIFPTIRAVSLLERGDGGTRVLVQHVEGPVINVLRPLSATQVELCEWKRRYFGSLSAASTPPKAERQDMASRRASN